jgi:hypothetical protein
MDLHIRNIHDIPHTLSYVIRKRQQVDSLQELPSEKRPPDNILWHNNPDLLTDWLDKVLERKGKKKEKDEFVLAIPEYEIEG